MAQRDLEHRVQNIERRLTSVEQIVPTLATKADLEAAIAPLATKAEVKAEAAETRRHFDVVAEGLHADIRMIAEGVVALQAAGDARHVEVMGILARHDRRLTRLEASPSERR